METTEENGKPEPINDTDLVVIEDLRRPFDVICDDLASLGALSVEDFLNNATSAVFDVNFHLQLPDLPSPEKDKEKPAKADDPEESKPASAMNGKPNRNAVTLLRHACENALGSSEALKYEYLETDPQSRQCILTITRPTGATRAYKSEAGPIRRADAKMQAAQIAVDMGAIDFITSGDADALKAKKGLLLNPLDAGIDDMELDFSVIIPPSAVLADKGPVEEIEDCCVDWRAGKVKPHWVYYNEPKNKRKHGVALRIALNAHLFRSYSVDPVHTNAKTAKIACAKSALEQGVLEFIQYGNGQTKPKKVVDEGDEEIITISRGSPGPSKGHTLQEYYETLPQPFPEDVGTVAANEINGPAWLNMALQSARGGRLVSTFVPVVDGERHLHGCVLRIERPGEIRTYFVDPQFPKRSDARSAVCLLAMSQGVGDYIRELKEEAENKLPADKRKLAVERLLPLLATESGKVRFGNRLNFTFVQERDAFGCTLKVDISPNADSPDVREYVAQTEYRTKADAKAAAACIAVEDGLIDLLRFKGAALPSDYVPFWEAQMNGDGDNYVPKRKEPEREDTEGRVGKKRKRGNKDNTSDASEVSAPRTLTKVKLGPEGHPLPPKPASLPPIPDNSSRNARWKMPHATGSRGLGPTNAYASAPRSVGQDRSGNRSGGPPTHPRGYRDMSPSHSKPAPRAYPPSYDDRPPYDDRIPYDDRAPYDERMDYRRDPSYRQPGPAYSRLESYGSPYPPYPPPPPVQGHYPGAGYPPSPPPPPHHYAAYYGSPLPPPTPSHDPYGHGHYSYPGHYPPPPQHYVHAPYPVSYPPHPPAVYSPPPPMPMMPPSPPAMAPNDPYAQRYRSMYPPRSPPHPAPYAAHPHPHPSASPRHSHHSHHASEYNSSSELSRHPQNHRRHNTIGDSARPHANGYHSRPLPDNDNGWGGSRHSHSSTPVQSSSIDSRGHGRDRPPSTPPRKPTRHREPERSSSEIPVKAEPVAETTPVEIQAPARIKLEASLSQSSVQSSTKSNLDVLNEFCEKENIQKPLFYHQVIHEKDGSKTFIVWAEKDSQRMELQNHFPSIEEGHEKLSKRILAYERSKMGQK